MRDLRIEVCAAFICNSNRIDDSLGIGALEAIGIGAGSQSRENFFFEIDHRHDDDARRRQFGADALVSARRRRAPECRCR